MMKMLFVSSLVVSALSFGVSISQAASPKSCISEAQARELLPKVAPNLCTSESGNSFRTSCSCKTNPTVESWDDGGYFFTYCIKDMIAVAPEADSMTWHKGYVVTCDGKIKEDKYAD